MPIQIAKFCHDGKQHIARGYPYPAGMKTGGIDALVKNVARLMAERGDTQTTVAARGGISQRAVGYIATYGKTHHTSPTLRTVEGLAKAFDVPAWMLLIPDMPLDLLAGHRLPDLIENYCEASSVGRDTVDRVAAAEARYGERGQALFSKSA